MSMVSVDCFLIVAQDFTDRGGFIRQDGSAKIRVCKGKPDLGRNEVAIRFHVELPEALFIKPSLSAKITIPESAGLNAEISAEVQDNITDAIRQASGMDVRLVVEGPEQ